MRMGFPSLVLLVIQHASMRMGFPSLVLLVLGTQHASKVLRAPQTWPSSCA
jgi:hypothetical protein